MTQEGLYPFAVVDFGKDKLLHKSATNDAVIMLNRLLSKSYALKGVIYHCYVTRYSVLKLYHAQVLILCQNWLGLSSRPSAM